MIYPLVQELAADNNIPVVVTCRVLGFSKQAFYKGQAEPVSRRDSDDAHLINAAIDIHHDDPEVGYRYIRRRVRRPGDHRLPQWRLSSGSRRPTTVADAKTPSVA